MCLKPFTRSQARELQVLQRLFMKKSGAWDILLPSKGCYALVIAFVKDEGALEGSKECKMELKRPLGGLKSSPVPAGEPYLLEGRGNGIYAPGLCAQISSCVSRWDKLAE